MDDVEERDDFFLERDGVVCFRCLGLVDFVDIMAVAVRFYQRGV